MYVGYIKNYINITRYLNEPIVQQHLINYCPNCNPK